MDDWTAWVAIIDDEASIRKSLLRLFKIAKYPAQAFGSADAFLESLSERTPSCVVLDLQLPGMSGIELLERFAAMSDAPPVVVITSNDEQRVHDQCVALGSKRFFRKPLDGGALVSAVREILEPAPLP